jgi:phosphatidylglycerol:prolipoprotein diacylglycerol transferase
LAGFIRGREIFAFLEENQGCGGMKPALLQFPHISSYPVLLLLGFFFGWLLARRRRTRFGITGNDIDNITLLLPLAGLFGARFFARLFYENVPLIEALQVWRGDGLVFYGGFVFCVFVIAAYTLARRINFLALADCLAPALALGLAFGRVGCFLAGCCWGDVCTNVAIRDPVAAQRIQTFPAISGAGFPLAVTFPQESAAAQQHRKLALLSAGSERSLPVHPVQLYEAALAAALCGLLHVASARNVAPGSLTLAMLLGYAFIRFCTEFLRADNKLHAGDFTFSQVMSLWVAALCVLVLAARRLTRPPAVRTTAVPCTPRPASG